MVKKVEQLSYFIYATRLLKKEVHLVGVKVTNGQAQSIQYKNSKDYLQISNIIDNCGTLIRGNLNILVVACPSFNNSKGLVSIYDRTNRKLLARKEGSWAGEMKAYDIGIISYNT